MDAARTSEFWRSMAISLWTAQGLVATVLLSRRLSGEFVGPDSAPIVMLWWTLSLVWSGAGWWAFRQSAPQQFCSTLTARYVPESLAGILALTAVLSGTPLPEPGVVGLLAGVVVIVVGASYGIVTAVPLLDDLANPVRTAAPHPAEPALPSDPIDHAADSSRPLAEAVGHELALCATEDSLQTMTRRQERDAEIVEGVLRVEFQDSQRETVIHVSFCPPLASRPEVELEDLDGNSWDLKIAACYPFGLRLSVRRRPNGSATGRIAYFASAAIRRAA